MSQSGWTVNLTDGSAVHVSGMLLKFEGVPESTNFSVSPGRVPESLKAIEVVGLIREGVEAFKAEYEQTNGEFKPAAVPSEKKPTIVKVRRRARTFSADRS